jgi:hypothetical protein
MTKEIKNAKLTLSGGILLILVGIFCLLFYYSPDNRYFYKNDFYPIAVHNVYILAAFCVILIGVLTELVGKYKLAKALNDMKIFYNRLNLYFIATLFILISIKDWMAENERFFFVVIRVSKRRYDESFTISEGTLVGLTILFLLILLIYFLLKDYIYLSRAFKSKLPIITLAVCIVSILLFFSKEIFGSFLPYESRNFLKSLMSIKVFIPYLVMCFITYLFMRASADEVKDFSIYDFIFSKRKIFLLTAAVFIAAIASWMFAHRPSAEPLLLYKLFFLLLFAPLLLSPLLLFFVVMFRFKLKILLIILSVIFGIVLVLFGLSFFQTTRDILVFIMIILSMTLASYSFIVPVSLALCAALKLQQRNFTKSSVALMAVSCITFGYFAIFSEGFI